MTVLKYRPRVLLAVDMRGWAFDHIAIQLQRHLSDHYDFYILPYRDVEPGTQVDLLVSFWWGALPYLTPRVKFRSCISAVYDQYYWNDAAKLAALLNGTLVVAANERIAAVLSPHVKSHMAVCEDGVDLGLFPPRPMPSQFTVGWTGNSKAGDGRFKGLALIQSACSRINARLLVRDLSRKLQNPTAENEPPWPIEHMSQGFYANISVYCCASTAEGTPNPVLESLASARPVVTTDVGIVPCVIENGKNGHIVDRSVDAIANALAEVRRRGAETYSESARAAAIRYDWRTKVLAWKDALDCALEMGRMH